MLQPGVAVHCASGRVLHAIGTPSHTASHRQPACAPHVLVLAKSEQPQTDPTQALLVVLHVQPRCVPQASLLRPLHVPAEPEQSDARRHPSPSSHALRGRVEHEAGVPAHVGATHASTSNALVAAPQVVQSPGHGYRRPPRTSSHCVVPFMQRSNSTAPSSSGHVARCVVHIEASASPPSCVPSCMSALGSAHAARLAASPATWSASITYLDTNPPGSSTRRSTLRCGRIS